MQSRAASVTVANGATTSGALDTGGRDVLGFYIPAGLEGTTMTFLACDTLGGTYLAVTGVGGGAALSLTVAASLYVPVDPNVFAGVRFLKVVLATQTGAIIIGVALRG